VRVVVVGASSGLGRSVGVGLAARGAQVAMLARRVERLERAAAEAGNGSVAISCDVTDEASVAAAIKDAASALGGIDGLVYSTGTPAVGPLEDMSADRWARLFATNVTGAALATAHALPYLRAAGGTAIYFSSISASLTPPWPMIGAYVTSKAALDKLVEAWRCEHPDVGFTRLAMGDSAGGAGESGTEFAGGEDRRHFKAGLEEWFRRGYVTGDLIDVEDLAHVVDGVLRLGASASIPVVSVVPRAARPTEPAETTETTETTETPPTGEKQ